MLRYCQDICRLAHHIIDRYQPKGSLAVDGTLGHGLDTRFLWERFERVVAFEIQSSAVAAMRAQAPSHVQIVEDSHANMLTYIYDPVDVVMFNLGKLPGSENGVITTATSTVKAIESGLDLLKPGGMMTVAVYLGHEGGAEEAAAVDRLMAGLSLKMYGVMQHKLFNRSAQAPYLYAVERVVRGVKR